MLYSKDRIFLSVICMLIFFGATCTAQNHPVYSQYMFNGLALNPAYAGNKDALNIAALYRSSQLGKNIEGSPVTQTFAGDFPLQKQQLALGLMIFNDKAGALRNSGAYFAYAYRVKTEKGKLAFGMFAGFDIQHEDYTKIILVHQDDPLFDFDVNNSLMPNTGVGTYYNMSNFFAGLSIPRLITYTAKESNSYKGKMTLANTKLYGGMIFSTDKDVKIKPSTLLQYAGKGFLWDLNCNFLLLNDRLELGISWRNAGVLVSMFQVNINQLSIGYAYDAAIGNPKVINTTHEIMLRYDLNYVIKAVSPLYF